MNGAIVKMLLVAGMVSAAVLSATAESGKLDAVAWIGDGCADREGADWYLEDPATEFAAEFVMPAGVSEGRLHFAAAGYATVKVNEGEPLMDESGLSVPWSVFGKTVYSKTHAFVALPHPATNRVVVRLGNGFYNLPPLLFLGKYIFRNNLAHGRPCFKLSIDGLARPLEWKWRRTNVMRNCVYLGCEIDATRGEDAEWVSAAAVQGPTGKLVPWNGDDWPLKTIGRDAGHAKWLREGEVQVVDFGTNASGVPSFRFRGERAGERVEILYGERLNADGTVNVLTQTAGQIKAKGKGGAGAPDIAAQRDAYICRGGDETFTPQFTWHIFRYAEVRGAKGLLGTDCASRRNVSGVGESQAGKVTEPTLAKIHEICLRTFQANLIGGVQSDCPGRERLGYGGDIVATCEAYMLNWDMRELYLKALRDFADEAEDDGWITETAPFVGIKTKGYGGRSGPISWTVAVPVLMEALMRHYPDITDRVLAFYPVCARYVRLMDAKFADGCIENCIGDHEALKRAPNKMTAMAHWYLFARLTADFARQLGRMEDAAEFAAIALKTKRAFAERYVKDGVVANGSQSAQAIALYLGLVPEAQVAAAESALVKAVEKADFAPTTGIFGTRYLLMYLSEHGRVELARRIVLHGGYPGWRHMLDRGATTLWETWKESDNIYSNCHPMFGSVDEWILRFGR